MVLLVGPPAAGKTTLRGRLVAAGLPADLVVSLDDLRRQVAARVVAAGGPVRTPEQCTPRALREAAVRQAALLGQRRGYLADATHLRRRERVPQVRAAHDAGLPAVAVLLPELPPAVLRARNAARTEDARVPDEVLDRHVHRRSLLDAGALRAEGFDEVVEPGPDDSWTVLTGAAGWESGDAG